MKRAALFALVCAMGVPPAGGGQEGGSVPAQRKPASTPVLVELFTSEGCSSCPPADELLSSIAASQPIAGVRIIALGEHVDYWNDLGWVDRFSSKTFTDRQTEYDTRAFPESPVYTPQLVVDGAFEAVGSDTAAVRRAITRAARAPKAEVRVTPGAVRSGRLPVGVDVSVGGSLLSAGPADVLVALVEDGLVTDVLRGENRGRTLTHKAVVRRLERAGSVDASHPKLSLQTSVAVRDDFDAARLGVVAFVQQRASRRVLGAASAKVSRPCTPCTGDEEKASSRR